jgi:hypothetical protein
LLLLFLRTSLFKAMTVGFGFRVWYIYYPHNIIIFILMDLVCVPLLSQWTFRSRIMQFIILSVRTWPEYILSVNPFFLSPALLLSSNRLPDIFSPCRILRRGGDA